MDGHNSPTAPRACLLLNGYVWRVIGQRRTARAQDRLDAHISPGRFPHYLFSRGSAHNPEQARPFFTVSGLPNTCLVTAPLPVDVRFRGWSVSPRLVYSFDGRCCLHQNFNYFFALTPFLSSLWIVLTCFVFPRCPCQTRLLSFRQVLSYLRRFDP